MTQGRNEKMFVVKGHSSPVFHSSNLVQDSQKYYIIIIIMWDQQERVFGVKGHSSPVFVDSLYNTLLII